MIDQVNADFWIACKVCNNTHLYLNISRRTIIKLNWYTLRAFFHLKKVHTPSLHCPPSRNFYISRFRLTSEYTLQYFSRLHSCHKAFQIPSNCQICLRLKFKSPSNSLELSDLFIIEILSRNWNRFEIKTTSHRINRQKCSSFEYFSVSLPRRTPIIGKIGYR